MPKQQPEGKVCVKTAEPWRGASDEIGTRAGFFRVDCVLGLGVKSFLGLGFGL